MVQERRSESPSLSAAVESIASKIVFSERTLQAQVRCGAIDASVQPDRQLKS